MRKGSRKYDYDPVAFGEAVGYLRKELGLSPDLVADKADIHYRATLQQVEVGIRLSLPDEQRRGLVNYLCDEAERQGVKIDRRDFLALAGLPIVGRDGGGDSTNSGSQTSTWGTNKEQPSASSSTSQGQHSAPPTEKERVVSLMRRILDNRAMDVAEVEPESAALIDAHIVKAKSHDDDAIVVAGSLIASGLCVFEQGAEPPMRGIIRLRKAAEYARQIGHHELHYYAMCWQGQYERKVLDYLGRHYGCVNARSARSILHKVIERSPSQGIKSFAYCELAKVALALMDQGTFADELDRAEAALCAARHESSDGGMLPWLPHFFEVVVRETKIRGISRFSGDYEQAWRAVKRISSEMTRFPLGLTLVMQHGTTKYSEIRLLLRSTDVARRQEGVASWGDTQESSQAVGYVRQLFTGKRAVAEVAAMNSNSLPLSLGERYPCTHCGGRVILDREDACYECMSCGRPATPSWG